jgi:myo-inositol-1(or 4)-monophosphatase
VGDQQEDVKDAAELLTAATRAMDIAADMARNRRPTSTRPKGDRDMVTDLDIGIERAVQASLHQSAPGVGFLSEEENSDRGIGGLTWALDPIDGTANLVRGLPLFAVSLALIRDDRPVLGIIDLPALSQRYSAVKGQGATLNGRPLHVRRPRDLADAMVTMGDYAVGDNASARNALRLAVTAQLARKVLRVRMLGSAAIDLAWLAEGKTDVCITLGGHPWDIAAGLIIASEAGARFVDLEGHPHTLQSKSMIGAAPDLIPEVICLIADAQG